MGEKKREKGEREVIGLDFEAGSGFKFIYPKFFPPLNGRMGRGFLHVLLGGWTDHDCWN